MTARRTRRGRVAAWIAVVLALVVVLAVGALALGVGTTPGARFLLARFAPEALAVERVEGALLEGLVLHEVAWDGAAADVRVEELRLTVDRTDLLARTLTVEELVAEGVRVVRRPEAGTGEPFDYETFVRELPEPTLPMRVVVESARVEGLEVAAAGREGRPLRVERIAAAGEVGRRGGVRLDTLAVHAPTLTPTGLGLSLGIEGELRATDTYPFDLGLAYEVDLPDRPSVRGGGRIGGTLADLALEQRLEAPVEAGLEAELSDLLGRGSVRARLRLPRAALQRLDAELPEATVAAEVRAEGPLDAVAVLATLDLDLPERGRVGARLRGRLAGDSLRVDTLAVDLPGERGRVLADARLDLGSRTPRFAVEGRWTFLALPPAPAGEGEVVSPRGEFALAGSPAAWRAGITAELRGGALPPGDWSLEAAGDTAGLVLEGLRGRTLGGTVRVEGVASWSPVPSWRLRATARDLEPERFRAWLPSALSLALVSSGRLADAGPTAELTLTELGGRWRGEPLAGRVTASLRGERTVVDTLHLEVGDAARLSAAGSLGPRSDLRWLLAASDLAALLPEGEGSVRLAGTLSGPRRAPALRGELEAEAVEVADVRVASVTGDLGLHLSGDSLSSVDLRAEGIGGDLLAERVPAPEDLPLGLTVTGRGRPGEHELEVGLASSDDSLRLRLAGGVAQGGGEGGRERGATWEGRLAELAIRTPASRWELDAPAGLAVGEALLRLDSACVRATGGAETCLQGRWGEGEGGAVDLRAASMPLELVGTFLPADLRLEGRFEAAAAVRVDPAGAWTGSARVDAGPGALRYTAGEEPVTRALEAFRLAVEADSARLTAELEARLDGGSLAGTLRAPVEALPPGSPRDTWGIAGELTGRWEDRGLAGNLAETLTDTDGVLRLDLRAGGTFGEPRVTGELALLEGTAHVVPLGVPVHGVRLLASSEDATRWRLEGEALSGDTPEEGDEAGAVAGRAADTPETIPRPAADAAGDLADVPGPEPGQLLFRGGVDLDPATRDWRARLALRAEEFEGYRTAYVRALASPELEIVAVPGLVEVAGEVRLPEAELDPGEYRSAVVPSEDVVLVAWPGEEPPAWLAAAVDEEPEPGADPMAAVEERDTLAVPFGEAFGGGVAATEEREVRADVRLVMGDSVRLDAFGLEGRLEGALRVAYRTEEPMTASGELEIVDGTYTAYQQELTVERGRLLFAGGSVDDPALDVQVRREVEEEDIVVGLDVGGTAQAPRTTIFSDPNMAESQALAYLLLGRPLSRASPAEGEFLTNAAQRAGIAGGDLLAARLASAFGLDEARVEGEDGGASLMLGETIAPNLYIAYSLGLFEASDVLLIRYEFGRGWILQTETGFETSADLLYMSEP